LYLNKSQLMEIIFMLTGISLLLALFFLGAFVWAAKSGQFEDDFTPSVRILFDDALASGSNKNVEIEKSTSTRGISIQEQKMKNENQNLEQ
jgi:cbb3-type cytochrome oxidase maturation protein